MKPSEIFATRHSGWRHRARVRARDMMRLWGG